jgi:integrase
LRLLKEFEQAKSYKLTLERIDMNFYYKFTEWMFIEYKNRRGKVGTEPNTVGKHIRTIKAFMNYMTRTGMNTNLAFQDKAFKDFNQETDIVYLTKEELEKMISHDFSYDSKLEKVRDLFIFECAVGLRYSDLQNLKPENIKEDAIDFTTIKTRDRIRIPLTSYARQILTKYNGALPKPYGFKRMNDLLKEVGRLSGIDANEQRVKYKGSTRVELTIPKHELLTPHCARRTFITQSLERGLRPEVIMKLTGHKSYDTMKRYIKLTQDVVERELLQAWGDAPSSIKAV